MIFGFDFQRDEVSFSFLLSHPTALSCIGGAHKAGNIGALHQRTQGVKLLFLIVRDNVLPFLRQNRQVVIAPFFETLVISPGVGTKEGRQEQAKQEVSATGAIIDTSILDNE